MNILIENQEAPEFLNTLGGWTKDLLEAKIFPNTQAALRAGRQEAIGRFNVVGQPPGSRQFFNLQRGRGTFQPVADK